MSPRERKARERVTMARDEAERARAEAQWCHGYRTKGGDTQEMRDKENSWWVRYYEADTKYRRALAALLRVVREEARRDQ